MTEQMIDPEKILGLEELTELGVVVNLKNDAPKDEEVLAEEQIKELELPVTVTFKLSSEQRIRLARLCKDFNTSESEFISNLVTKELESRIGRASISGPSMLHGQPIKGTGTVTGPSNSAHMWRAFDDGSQQV